MHSVCLSIPTSSPRVIDPARLTDEQWARSPATSWEKHGEFAASEAKGKPCPRAFERATVPLETAVRDMQKGKQTPGRASAAGVEVPTVSRKETSEDAERGREGEEAPLEAEFTYSRCRCRGRHTRSPSLSDLTLLLQSHKIFLKAMLRADGCGGASPAPWQSQPRQMKANRAPR